MLGLFRSLAFGLLVAAIPVALLTTTVRFAASEPRVYDYSVREYNAEAASRIPEGELVRANRELVSYFTADKAEPLHVVVTNDGGQEEELFNARETAHLADVRDLFQALFTVQVMSVALVLTLAVALLLTSTVRTLVRGALYGSMLTVSLVGASGILAATGFDSAWQQFHFLAFTNDLWELNPATDHLIQMFPRNFWFDITLLLGAFTMLEALLIGSMAGAYLYVSQGREAEGEPLGAGRPFMASRERVPPPGPRPLTH